jgi:lipoate synthase
MPQVADEEQCAFIRPWRREARWGGGMMTGAERLTYEIRVRGELTDALVVALQALNLHVEQTANGTILVGAFRDQSELHGALQAMQDFGVELVEVRQR